MDIHDWPLRDKERLFNYLGTSSYCSERHKLLYVATPKVACTSLKWWFADLEGYTQALRKIADSAETDPDLVIHDSFHKVAPRVAGLYPEALVEPLCSDAYFRFAVVRNPYKRLFSAWQSKLLLREPLQVTPYLDCDFYNHPLERAGDVAAAFESFLEHLEKSEAPNYWDVHWTPQATLLRPDLIRYSKLVQIENTKELSGSLASWLGSQFVDPFACRRANESLIPYLPEFITERSSELIRKLHAADFDRFGYDRQPPAVGYTFTKDQFELAVRAILMIRGRHLRFGEVRSYFNQQVSRLSQDITTREEAAAAVQLQAQNLLTERDQAIAELTSRLQELEEKLAATNAILNEIRSHWGMRYINFLPKINLSEN